MADFINKSFAGTDGQLITDLDPLWVRANTDIWTGLSGIAANRLYSGSTAYAGAYYNQAPPSADYELSTRVYRGTGEVGQIQVFGRFDTVNGHGYMGGYHDYGYLAIRRIDWGYDTRISDLIPGPAVAPGETITMRLRFVGSTISLYVNDETTPRLTVEDTTYTAAGVCGIELNTIYGESLGAAETFKASTLDAVDLERPTLTGSITETGKTSTSIAISWPAGADNVGIAGYDVSRDAGATWTNLGNVLSHNFTGLTASTAYPIRVRARDAEGNVSDPPLEISITTGPDGDTTKPELIGVITVGQKTNNSISISWPAGTDNVAVTSYEVSSNGGTSWTDTGSTALTRTITGLTPLTAYNIRVRAKDGAGNVSDSPLAITTSTYRDGATGATIRATTGPVGGALAGILYNDVEIPGDEDKWFSFFLIDGPHDGLTMNPDGTFTYGGAANIVIKYQLEVDGQNFGDPIEITLYTRATVVSDLAVSYPIRGRVSSDLVLSYPIRAVAFSDYSVSYPVRAPAYIDFVSVYVVRGAVQSDLGVSYLVRGLVFDNYNINYPIQAPVFSDLVVSYDIVESSTVISDLEVAYDIRGKVTDDYVVSYPIQAPVVSDLVIEYPMYSMVFSDLPVSYQIRNAVIVDYSVGYQIHGEGGFPIDLDALAEAIWARSLVGPHPPGSAGAMLVDTASRVIATL